jgi:serine/threonine protein kinase/tetratricopeptide (TPR) repeat protein
MVDSSAFDVACLPSGELKGLVAGRFLVSDCLGVGAMGEVYRAHDTKLKRIVALKRMSAPLRADLQYRERFFKEAQRASQLSDNHIAAIYDVLEEGGEILLVMEFVEGETLRHRLLRPLSLEEFLHIAMQCVAALSAAHAHRIVHCDVKPENIMLTPAGQVKILDFGLAKHFPRPDETTVSFSELTSVGGTIGYTAPEVLCEQQVDERADIFSLGVVFYEMLAGVRPFVAETTFAIADKVLHGDPVPLRDLNSDIPLGLEHIITRMLTRSLRSRYSSAVEVHADLRSLNGSSPHPLLLIRHILRLHWKKSVCGLALALVFFLLLAVPPARNGISQFLGLSSLPQRKNLAILSFSTSDGDVSKTAFTNGLAEMLSAKLAQLSERHHLVVVAPREVRAQDVTTAQQALQIFGANLVLEGSLRQSGTAMRITYALVDTKSRRQLRADTITADASDPFAVEDRVAQSVVDALELELGAAERQTFLAHGTSEPAAYDFYLQGRGYLQDYHKPENLNSAITVFQHALDRDPNYALAYAGLGEAYWQRYEQTHDATWVDKALQACSKAAQLAPYAADGHACLGTAYNGTGKYEKAAEEFQRAIQLAPSDDAGYRGLGAAYERLGEPAQAEDTYLKAVKKRSDYWAVYNYLGLFYWKQGRYQSAADMFNSVVRLEPDNIRGYSNLGAMLLLQGRYQDAIPIFHKAAAIRPGSDVYSNLATAYFYLQRYPEAAQSYEQAAQLDPHNQIIQGNLGDVYYRTPGKRDLAMNAYHQAITLALEEVRVNPRDANLLGDLARYYAIVGDKPAAFKYLNRGLQVSSNNPELLFEAGLVHNQFGETEQALDWLAKSLKAGFSVASVRDEPLFENLRNDPRFQRLIQGKS